jgi:hypothetical protein
MTNIEIRSFPAGTEGKHEVIDYEYHGFEPGTSQVRSRSSDQWMETFVQNLPSHTCVPGNVTGCSVWVDRQLRVRIGVGSLHSVVCCPIQKEIGVYC